MTLKKKDVGRKRWYVSLRVHYYLSWVQITSEFKIEHLIYGQRLLVMSDFHSPGCLQQLGAIKATAELVKSEDEKNPHESLTRQDFMGKRLNSRCAIKLVHECPSTSAST